MFRNTEEKWLKDSGNITPKYQRKKLEGKLIAIGSVLQQALRTDTHRRNHARRSGKALFAQLQAQW